VNVVAAPAHAALGHILDGLDGAVSARRA